MSLIQQYWTSTIQENLFPKNDFVNLSISHDDFVTFNTVHVANAGAVPGITKNPTYPLTPGASRTDGDLTYTIDLYATDATPITDAETFQINYDKRLSVMQNTINALRNRLADELLYKWASASTVFNTSGSSSGTALSTSATGTRNKITSADALRLAQKFDKDFMPKDGRYLMLPTDMYYELLQDANILPAYAFGSAVLPDGYVPRVAGFNILERPTVLVSNGSHALKAYGASAASTDNYAGFAWHTSAVAKAMGAIKSYMNNGSGNGDALYQGIIISGNCFFGGTALRSDGKGVAVISQ